MNYVIFYLLAGCITIIAESTGHPMWMYVSKVLLMPLLAAYLYHESKEIKKYIFIYLALFFSWWGDIFLMLINVGDTSPKAKLFFIAGLVSFLIGQLNYIFYFIKEIKQEGKATILRKQPLFVLPFIIYIVILLSFLYPSLNEMKLPVTIYSIVIIVMAMAAFNRKNIASLLSFRLTFVGAVLFVFSDSCIAVNVFYHHFYLARVLIMSTYITAQLLIIKGVLVQRGVKINFGF